jgi:flagellar protein FliO/FliZ
VVHSAAVGVLLQTAELPGGYGVALIQTLIALAAVCVLAWVVLKWSARRGLGTVGQGKRVKVIERVPLDARRSLYLVEVGDKVLLLGAGEGSAPEVLTEIDPKTLPEIPDAGSALSFADVLAKLKGGEKG